MIWGIIIGLVVGGIVGYLLALKAKGDITKEKVIYKSEDEAPIRYLINQCTTHIS